MVHKVEMVNRNSLRLLKLVNTLLEFSRIEADRHGATFVKTDLAELTRNVASMFRSAFERAQIVYEVNVVDFHAKSVYVDQDMWEKILLNLISNAFKYTLEGRVSVTLTQDADFAILKVADTGIGISEEELPHLFQRFHRVKGVNGRSFEGSGIGCSLVLELVKLLHGTVDVESALGKGTTFTVSVPLGSRHLPPDAVEQSEKSDALLAVTKVSGRRSLESQAFVEEALRWLPTISTASSSPSPTLASCSPTSSSSSLLSSSSSSGEIDKEAMAAKTKLQLPQRAPRQTSSTESEDEAQDFPENALALELKLRYAASSKSRRPVILVADDNADMRGYINCVLSSFFTLVIRTNGLEAYEYLSDPSHPLPNLIVSDIMMPRMTGLELLRRVRCGIQGRRTEKLPVILLSARAGEDSRLDGLQRGADDYLVKPFSRRELLARVRLHLHVALTRERLERQLSKQTEELRASEQRYRELAMHVPAGIYTMDRQGKLTYANEYWRNLFMASDTPASTSLNANDNNGKIREEQKPLDSWLSTIVKEDKARVVETLNCSVATQTEAILEFRVRRGDGSIVWVFCRQIPLFDRRRNERVAGFLGVATDVTERKQLEKEKLEALMKTELEQRKRAQEAEENRNRLQTYVDVISHEIRNPISNIINIADLLKMSNRSLRRALFSPPPWRRREEEEAEEEPDEEGGKAQASSNGIVDWRDRKKREGLKQQLRSDLEIILAIELCANHQRLIADDVLELSRLQSTQLELCNEDFEPREMVKNVLTMFEASLRRKGIQVAMKVPPEEDTSLVPRVVHGDANRLSQVLVNLVSNSVKFMERVPDKRLIVTLSGEAAVNAASGDEEEKKREGEDEENRATHQQRNQQQKILLRLTVRDTGIGMTPEEQAGLFKPFSQANVKTYREYGGSGETLRCCFRSTYSENARR